MEKALKRLEKILDSMRADLLFINQQLAIHERICIKHDKPLGDDWHDVYRRQVAVLKEVIDL